MAIDAPSFTISDKIIIACPEYKDKIVVWEGTSFSALNEGREILIRFTGINGDVPQFQIASYSS